MLEHTKKKRKNIVDEVESDDVLIYNTKEDDDDVLVVGDNEMICSCCGSVCSSDEVFIFENNEPKVVCMECYGDIFMDMLDLIAGLAKEELEVLKYIVNTDEFIINEEEELNELERSGAD